MTRVLVLGAGVVGSCYAALLSQAGHEVGVVGRGARAHDLLERGLRVSIDGQAVAHTVRVDATMRDAADVLLVAVRGDQLDDVLDALAAHRAPRVLVLTNPLGRREQFEERLMGRLVWCFSGLGGVLDEGTVIAHRVRQQPTVVQADVPDAIKLLSTVDPHLRREPHMSDWLDVHTVFVAAMAATVLQQSSTSRRARWADARPLVLAVRQAFGGLQQQGIRVVPNNLRIVFTVLPVWCASLYWAHQLARPMTKVSMAPHARATRHTEQPMLAARALELVGAGAPAFSRLVQPLTSVG